MSAAVKKEEEEHSTAVASSPPPVSVPETTTADASPEKGDESSEADKKRRKTTAKNAPAKKPSEEVLQRRREGRIKAAATIAQNLKKTGIGRFEDQNRFSLTSVKTVPLINQKNYFADYLKKDEQAMLIRNWRNEKNIQAQGKDPSKTSSASDSKKTTNGDDDDDDDDDEDNEAEEGAPGKGSMGHDTIVIHPGSQLLRIGRATDGLPVTIPMVIAVPNKNLNESEYPVIPERSTYEDGEFYFGEEFDAVKAVVTKDFKARMRYYKRRMNPNSRDSAASFNKKQKNEEISDDYDPSKKEWFEKDDALLKERKYFAGTEALKLPINESWTEWKLRFPIVNGGLNQSPEDYESPQELLGDLIRITKEALREIDITSQEELLSLKCLLVIPDLYDKVYVEEWVNLLLNSIGFGRIGIIQEAVSSTFGAGVSCACVVDVGAEKTSIACVDEGMIINDSRVKLDYGGDHITEAFTKLLLQQGFPYRDINLANYNDDWELAENLKKDFCTFNDADVAVQLYEFHQRKPGKKAQKYNFKVYDEVMLAPLGLFYPNLFEIESIPRMRRLFPESQDHYTGEHDNPFSTAHERLATKTCFSDMTDEKLLLKLLEDKTAFKQANMYGKPRAPPSLTDEEAQTPLITPLEKAVIESITYAGIATDLGKCKKLYDNLLIVGGGLAKFPGFDVLLNDRINIWRPKFLSSSGIDDVLNYVGKEKEKVDNKRKEMINAAKKKKATEDQSLEDVELDEEDLRKIDEATAISLDLEKADSLSDQGTAIPVNVLPAPREFDPQELCWKGGSVYGRLKVVNEMWITQKDWDLLQTRCLYYKSLFNY